MYVYVYMYAYMHTHDRKNPFLINFAFFMGIDKMWDLPRDCQWHITGGLVDVCVSFHNVLFVGLSTLWVGHNAHYQDLHAECIMGTRVLHIVYHFWYTQYTLSSIYMC